MSDPVTKGMSENAISNVKKTADKIVHPVAVIASGETAAHHQPNVGSPSEQEDYQPEGETSKGFASSVVPTLEEKTIFERQQSTQQANGRHLFDLQEERSQQGGQDGSQTKSKEEREEPSETNVPRKTKDHITLFDGDSTAQKPSVTRSQIESSSKELFGTPANISTLTDDLPVRGTDRQAKGTDEGQTALKARKILRKHLNANVQVSPWSMPAPTPDINPNSFRDPLDGRFWKNVWVATAVHNVSDSTVKLSIH